MAQDNVDVIESAWKAFGKGDIEAVLSYFAESAEIVAPGSLPWGGSYEGPEGMRTLLARALEDFTEFKAVPEKVLGADDNHVIVVARNTGRTKGGERTEQKVVWIYQLRDGSITGAEIFADTAATLEALG
ncbi:MAG TPA: nuclear transport factor 2 family protein [Solirubrobacterales bacterium]